MGEERRREWDLNPRDPEGVTGSPARSQGPRITVYPWRVVHSAVESPRGECPREGLIPAVSRPGDVIYASSRGLNLVP